MKKALITGASSGIGEQFAYELARRGYHVIVAARREERLKKVVSNIESQGGSAEYMVADLVSLDDIDRMAKWIESNPIDLLVNNAGFGGYGLFQTISSEREQEMITLNIAALTKLTRSAVETMLERNQGSVINVASTAAFQPVPYMAVYGATKSFVLHYTEAIAAELRHSNVHVMALCPGGTATEFSDRAQVNGFFSTQFTMQPEEVVLHALKGMDKREVIVVPGFKNTLMSIGYRFVPRKLLVNSVANVFRSEKKN